MAKAVDLVVLRSCAQAAIIDSGQSGSWAGPNIETDLNGFKFWL